MKKIIMWIVVLILIIVGIFVFNKKSAPVSNEPIKIGVILPLSGDAAIIGEAAKNATILAKESFKNTKKQI